ncbi:MAG: hypothetical protein M5U33_05585 [Pseudorhodoplanes sp.]|nr:hypothetical protein [Pseudorhodoplanes sp.]MCL4710727.1 hypothetical protein [Pseudorhodoplanes sp.]MCQ3942609.1 hypothetical protein [Alphaproteobacteria bacterium]MCZ7642295.1 hypothetical protein [Pseudorhodoplanes sp.]GIK82259.1 MAG: hypothetical protein BroJett024_33640 [Alphaproteobacteria bacterium]
MQTTPTEVSEIAIRIRSLGQLFNLLDPSPFFEKDLDSDAEEFIVGWARELPRTAAVRIAIYLPPEIAALPETARLGEVLAHYFNYRARMIERDLRELFRIGRSALAIGILALVLCLTASQLVAPLAPNPTAARIIEESFIIVGWVANWRPIEIYLYDWWPLRRRVQLYRRIAAAAVVIKPE